MQVDYEITTEGLVFTADEETRNEIRELLAEQFYAYVEEEVFEDALCNGLSWVYPEEIGALTSSPIFADGASEDNGQFAPDTRFFWFPSYQVESHIETLMNTGRVVFTEATEE